VVGIFTEEADSSRSTFCSVSGTSPVQTTAGKPTDLTESLHAFSQSAEANAGIILHIRIGSLPCTYFHAFEISVTNNNGFWI
jgi:hypothetical protein